MEIFNKSRYDILVSDKNILIGVYAGNNYKYNSITSPFNTYLKLHEDLILVKKVAEVCNKIIIKDSLIQNEVEIEIIKIVGEI